MSYISAITRSDEVIIWERTEHGREQKRHPAPYYFYVESPEGKYKTIYGKSVSRVEFSTSKEFKSAKDDCESRGIRMYESDISPDLRILAHAYRNIPAPKLHISLYDIEVDYDPLIGFSSPMNPYAPINAIALLHYWNNEMYILAVPPEDGWTQERLMREIHESAPHAPIDPRYKVELLLCKNERELLLTFLELIYDSDVIAGWNSDLFDTPYVTKRIEMVLGKRFTDRMDFDGVGSPQIVEVLNRDKTKTIGHEVRLRGRISTDYMRLVKKYEPGERSSYKLSSVSDEVLVDSDGKAMLPKLEYSGTLADLYRKNFAYFMRYNVRDTEILGGFEDKLGYIELANQMYHSSAGQFSHVLGTIKLAELAIVNYCHELKQIVPDFKRSDIDRQIDGALVLLPQIGEHKNVGSIDINSLYPSAIRSINISPETLRAQFTMYEHAVLEIYKGSLVDLTLEIEETGEQITKPAYEWKQWLLDRKWSVSGYGTCFDQSVPGIIPTILSEWYAQRKHYQKLKKEAEGRAAAILKKYIDEDKVE